MKRMAKMTALMLAIAIIISAVPVNLAEAKGETWVKSGDGWTYLDGTDVRMRIDGETLRIEGSGEIPDYDLDTLYERPWSVSDCKYLRIDKNITYIGSYAFYGMENLKYIFISSKTFVNDTTCFQGISDYPIFRVNTEGETLKSFGSIVISSYDSIKRIAQQNSNNACYIMDTMAEAKRFQESTNPTIQNVYSAKDSAAPWNDVDKNKNGGVATTVCEIVTLGVPFTTNVVAQRRYQGNACYEVFSAFLGDYSFATSYNLILMDSKGKVYTTDKELQYTLTIPKEYRAAGRTFRLLAIGQGEVYVYDDIDASNETITFSTDRLTTAYALIYK